MTNHVATLLIGQDGRGGAVTPLDLYTPPTFRAPTAWPTGLVAARRALFGLDPDRPGILYRVRRLLAFVHGTPELDRLARAHDPRLTYTARDAASWLWSAGIEAQRLYGSATLYWTESGPPDRSGRLERHWSIDLRSDGTIAVTPTNPTGAATEHLLGFEAGLSRAVALPGSNIAIRIGAVNAYLDPADIERWLPVTTLTPVFETGPLPPDDLLTVGPTSWTLVRRIHPPDDPADTAHALTNAPGALAALFGVGESPYDRLRTLWTPGRPLPVRLGAAAIALALRTGDIARG